MANYKRTNLIQEFFETLTSMNRLVSDNRDINGHKNSGGSAGAKEPRKPQTELMYLLTKEKELSIKEIAAAMYITSSAATQMVENLVVQGLVQRADHPKDRRIVRVLLTPKGKAQFAIFRKTHLNRIDGLLKTLSNDELKFMISIRKKIIRKIGN